MRQRLAELAEVRQRREKGADERGVGESQLAEG